MRAMSHPIPGASDPLVAYAIAGAVVVVAVAGLFLLLRRRSRALGPRP